MPTPTDASRIQRLEDRAALAELVFEYARLLDEGEPDAMAELFTEDAQIDYGPALGGAMTGRDAIRRFLQGIHGFARTSHHVSNHQLRFHDQDADRVDGRCYVLAWHEWPDDRPNAVLYGRYEDRYRRTPEGWRIAARNEVQHGQEHFELAWNWIERRNAPQR